MNLSIGLSSCCPERSLLWGETHWIPQNHTNTLLKKFWRGRKEWGWKAVLCVCLGKVTDQHLKCWKPLIGTGLEINKSDEILLMSGKAQVFIELFLKTTFQWVSFTLQIHDKKMYCKKENFTIEFKVWKINWGIWTENEHSWVTILRSWAAREDSVGVGAIKQFPLKLERRP